MRTSVRLCGAAVISAASLTMVAAPAFADSAGNNGVNLLNDNNISVAPIQACPGKLTVVGDLVTVLNSRTNSPNSVTCAQAPISDHSTPGS